jgi:hypothetical protein
MESTALLVTSVTRSDGKLVSLHIRCHLINKEFDLCDYCVCC